MRRILIVDDDTQFLQMLRQTLERAGYEVLEAPDGKQGIRLYRDEPTDLIITDIMMPKKEGSETIMELKRDFPDVKIIAVSGGGRVDPGHYLEIACRCGADRTFTKPFDRAELLEAIQQLLDDVTVS